MNWINWYVDFWFQVAACHLIIEILVLDMYYEPGLMWALKVWTQVPCLHGYRFLLWAIFAGFKLVTLKVSINLQMVMQIWTPLWNCLAFLDPGLILLFMLAWSLSLLSPRVCCSTPALTHQSCSEAAPVPSPFKFHVNTMYLRKIFYFLKWKVYKTEGG